MHEGPCKSPCDFLQAAEQDAATSSSFAGSREPLESPVLFRIAGHKSCCLPPQLANLRTILCRSLCRLPERNPAPTPNPRASSPMSPHTMLMKSHLRTHDVPQRPPLFSQPSLGKRRSGQRRAGRRSFVANCSHPLVPPPQQRARSHALYLSTVHSNCCARHPFRGRRDQIRHEVRDFFRFSESRDASL